MLLAGIGYFGLIDLIFVPILVRSIKRVAFLEAKWPIIFTAGAVWFSIWAWVLSWSWDLIYVYIFPGWARAILPGLMALFYALVAWLMWRIALPRRSPVLIFLLLGGLTGILTHIFAVLRGITTAPPILQGASPLAAVAFAGFEFTLYWCVILSAAVLLNKLYRRVVPVGQLRHS